MPIASRYAEVNGIRIHYAVAGEGNGRLILFAHGFPQFWYAWKKQLEEFGRDWLAVAPDLRGYNLSDKPEGVEQYALRHIIADLRALAAHLGYERFTLVGHDWGGAMSWGFAIAHPELLERLVIINAPHPAIFERELRENRDQQRASIYMRRIREPGAEQWLAEDNFRRIRASLLDNGLAQGYFTPEDVDAYIAAWSQPGALTGGLNYYRAMRLAPPTTAPEPDQQIFITDLPPLDPAEADDPADVSSRPARPRDATALTVRVPTLVIWGEQDVALLPGNLDGLADYVPNLTLHRIPDAGHWVIHERPDVVNGHIREFIEG
jgi:pimeloyl-ACP methyl ester carboxylesterase